MLLPSLFEDRSIGIHFLLAKRIYEEQCKSDKSHAYRRNKTGKVEDSGKDFRIHCWVLRYCTCISDQREEGSDHTGGKRLTDLSGKRVNYSLLAYA